MCESSLYSAACQCYQITAHQVGVSSIFDLISRPDVVDACRKEIRAVLEASDGVMTTNALFNMKLMDSIMRESQRLNPPLVGECRTEGA